MLLFPMVSCVLFALVAGQDPRGLKIAVVNEETYLVSGCEGHSSGSGCNFSAPLSCDFLRGLRSRHYVPVNYPDLGAAKEAVLRNEAWAAFHFNKNYTRALQRRVNFEQDVDEFSDIFIWLDASSHVVAEMLKKHVYEVTAEFLENLFSDCSWPPDVIKIPVKFETPIYGSKDESFSNFTMPAFLAIFTFYLPLICTLSSMMMEKLSGVYQRSLVTGITVIEIGLSHMGLQLIICNLQLFLAMGSVYPYFGYRFDGSLLVLFVVMVSMEITATVFGFAASTLCDKETTATLLAIGSTFPMTLISSVLWPAEAMHWSLRPLAKIMPLNVVSEAFRNIAYKSRNFTDAPIITAMGQVYAWLVAGLILTFVSFKYKKII